MIKWQDIGYEINWKGNGMAIKCCGEERSTPFCSSCGKKLTDPSPLVSLLRMLRTRYKTARRKLEDTQKSFGNLSTVPKGHPLHKAREEEANVNGWIEAVTAAIGDNDWAKVHADWLEENISEEVANKLRGAFGVEIRGQKKPEKKRGTPLIDVE